MIAVFKTADQHVSKHSARGIILARCLACSGHDFSWRRLHIGSGAVSFDATRDLSWGARGLGLCWLWSRWALWQLQRLAWKEGVLAEIETRIAAEPVALP
ncbi:MAG: hypothetical protein EpisKO_30820 [Epibacterium sp.]